MWTYDQEEKEEAGGVDGEENREEDELLVGMGREVSNPRPQCRGRNVFQGGAAVCSGLSSQIEEGTKQRKAVQLRTSVNSHIPSDSTTKILSCDIWGHLWPLFRLAHPLRGTLPILDHAVFTPESRWKLAGQGAVPHARCSSLHSASVSPLCLSCEQRWTGMGFSAVSSIGILLCWMKAV